jgi:hypothetical protein
VNADGGQNFLSHALLGFILGCIKSFLFRGLGELRGILARGKWVSAGGSVRLH